MAEGGSMEDVVKPEVGEDTFRGNKNDPAICFVIENDSNGKPLPIGGFTG